MVETRQQVAGVSDLVHEQNPLELQKMLPQAARGSNPVTWQISQRKRSNAKAMVALKSRKALTLHPPHSTQSKPLKSREV